MLNDPRSLVEEQVSASGNLPGQDRRPSEAAAVAPLHAVGPDPLLGLLAWIAPPLALIAMLAISAI
jgi:hypothetical protein